MLMVTSDAHGHMGNHVQKLRGNPQSPHLSCSALSTLL